MPTYDCTAWTAVRPGAFRPLSRVHVRQNPFRRTDGDHDGLDRFGSRRLFGARTLKANSQPRECSKHERRKWLVSGSTSAAEGKDEHEIESSLGLEDLDALAAVFVSLALCAAGCFLLWLMMLILATVRHPLERLLEHKHAPGARIAMYTAGRHLGLSLAKEKQWIGFSLAFAAVLPGAAVFLAIFLATFMLPFLPLLVRVPKRYEDVMGVIFSIAEIIGFLAA